MSKNTGRLLSVVTMPKFSLRRSARDVARLVPPGFLLTTTPSFQSSTLCLIQRARRGSAGRLSTGHSKKPCIWVACRSMVMTWSTPATLSRLAIILAVMAPRCDFFFDCLEYGKYGMTAITGQSVQDPTHGRTGDRLGRTTFARRAHNKQLYNAVVDPFRVSEERNRRRGRTYCCRSAR